MKFKLDSDNKTLLYKNKPVGLVGLRGGSPVVRFNKSFDIDYKDLKDLAGLGVFLGVLNQSQN